MVLAFHHHYAPWRSRAAAVACFIKEDKKQSVYVINHSMLSFLHAFASEWLQKLQATKAKDGTIISCLRKSVLMITALITTDFHSFFLFHDPYEFNYLRYQLSRLER
jgi:hypothetical protein